MPAHSTQGVGRVGGEGAVQTIPAGNSPRQPEVATGAMVLECVLTGGGALLPDRVEVRTKK